METHLWEGVARSPQGNKYDSICCIGDLHAGRCCHHYKVRPYDHLVESINFGMVLPTWGRQALSCQVGAFSHWGGGRCEVPERVGRGGEVKAAGGGVSLVEN